LRRDYEVTGRDGSQLLREKRNDAVEVYGHFDMPGAPCPVMIRCDRLTLERATRRDCETKWALKLNKPPAERHPCCRPSQQNFVDLYCSRAPKTAAQVGFTGQRPGDAETAQSVGQQRAKVPARLVDSFRLEPRKSATLTAQRRVSAGRMSATRLANVRHERHEPLCRRPAQVRYNWTRISHAQMNVKLGPSERFAFGIVFKRPILIQTRYFSNAGLERAVPTMIQAFFND
jgi:hypothetical protein